MALLRRTARCLAPVVDHPVAPLSPSPQGSSEVPWMHALENFNRVFRHYLHHSTSSAHACGAAQQAMRLCLSAGRADDAVAVYTTLCSSGLVGVAPSPLSVIAREAMQQLPHHRGQGQTLSLLLSAETDEDWLEPRAAGPPLDAAEEFRVQLQQHLHVLRHTQQETQRLGKNWCLWCMQQVAESAVLQREVEVTPLLTLSKAVLRHPFSYSVPSPLWARAQMHVEQLWSSRQPDALSPSQSEQLIAMEETVRPVRILSQTTLAYLATVVPDWDALLLRRLAEVAVVPKEAHLVRATASSRRRRHRLEAPSGASSFPWLHAEVEMYAPPDSHSSGAEAAVHRVEGLLRRRALHDLVVPDASFLLHHFHQLTQLARHREVIVTHSVLVAVAEAAMRLGSPQRFHARRVLEAIMHRTTCVKKEEASRTSFAERKHIGGGFTILGLQDELALLEDCPERLASEGTTESAVLVARQLARMLRAHDRGESFNAKEDTLCGSAADVDLLVEGLLEGPTPTRPLRPAPLFKSRSRGYWAGMPVLLATTSDTTRTAAYMAGLPMYPAAAPAQ